MEAVKEKKKKKKRLKVNKENLFSLAREESNNLYLECRVYRTLRRNYFT